MDNTPISEEDATFNVWFDEIRTRFHKQVALRGRLLKQGLIYKIPVWLKLWISYSITLPQGEDCDFDAEHLLLCNSPMANYGYVYQGKLYVSHRMSSPCTKHWKLHTMFSFWHVISYYTDESKCTLKTLCYAPVSEPLG